MMHPDTLQLAAYLDGALDEGERVALRAHILTCPACAARLDQLHADERRIKTALTLTGSAPDVRAAVRARLRRPQPLVWLARGAAFASALALLLLFALVIGTSSGGTFGRTADRLFVTDKTAGQLVVLDAYAGARLDAVAVGDSPTEIRYDRRLDRLYVLLYQGVVAVDPRTLAIINRWEAPHAFGVNAAMALDDRQEWLYVSQPDAGVITQLDAETLTPAQSFTVGAAPGALALAPDGGALFIYDDRESAVWKLDQANGSQATRLLGRGDTGRRGWVTVDDDGQSVYVLLGSSSSGDQGGSGRGGPPELWRIDPRGGQASGPFAIERLPTPWDLLLLDSGHLAIARGDGRKGGVDIVATEPFSLTAQLDPSYDEHHLVAGPRGTVFALNWLHGTVTRYNVATTAVTWRTASEEWQPWDGVFVRGGWRWPW